MLKRLGFQDDDLLVAVGGIIGNGYRLGPPEQFAAVGPVTDVKRRLLNLDADKEKEVLVEFRVGVEPVGDGGEYDSGGAATAVVVLDPHAGRLFAKRGLMLPSSPVVSPVYAESARFQDLYVVDVFHLPADEGTLRETTIYSAVHQRLEAIGDFVQVWHKAGKPAHEVKLEGRRAPKEAVCYLCDGGSTVRYRFDLVQRQYVRN